MLISFPKFLVFFILYSLFCTVSLSTRLKKKIDSDVLTNDIQKSQSEDSYFRIRLKKLAVSEANKKKFYEFLTKSQSDLYTNFLIKSQTVDSLANIRKISLLNFQNIQVKIQNLTKNLITKFNSLLGTLL